MWRWGGWLMGRGVELVLPSRRKSTLRCRRGDRERSCRNCCIRGGSARRDLGTFRCRTVGAIMLGSTIPGCPTLRHLMPASMYRGGFVLSTVRALHGCRPDAGHANDAEEQHQHPSDLSHSYRNHSSDLTPHMGSLAVSLRGCNQESDDVRLYGRSRLPRRRSVSHAIESILSDRPVRGPLRPPAAVLVGDVGGSLAVPKCAKTGPNPGLN